MKKLFILNILLWLSIIVAMDNDKATKRERRKSLPVDKRIKLLQTTKKKRPLSIDLSVLKNMDLKSFEDEFKRENEEGEWDQEIDHQEQAKKLGEKNKNKKG